MDDTPERSTTVVGSEFEDEVKVLFELMGYRVEKGRLFNGRAVDLYAERRSPPADLHRVAIECKAHVANVTVADVDSFHSKVSASFNNGELDRGYLISKAGFAIHAKENARTLGILCLTYSELMRSLADFDKYVDELIHVFESSPVSSRYVSLEGTREEGTEEIPIKDLESFLVNWARTGPSNHLSILGEYGSGKSTLCSRVAHDLATAYKRDPSSNRIPILVNLREYTKSIKLEQLMTDLLVNINGIQITANVFMRMNDAGRFVLIFDGFDEMAEKVNFDTTVKNFEDLARTASSANSRVILTCRTEYFRTNREEQRVLSSDAGRFIDLSSRSNFSVVHIKPLTLPKVRLFLQKVDPDHADDNFAKIQATYNLFDLSRRPVLLDMIVDSLPKLAALGKSINAGRLYDAYTENWLLRDVKRGHGFLTSDVRREFVRKLATELQSTGKVIIPFKTLRERVKLEFQLEDRTELDYYEHEFRVCAYLVRDGEGNYKFAHKSFLEFFIAQNLKEEVSTGDTRGLQRYLAPEVIHFISDLIDIESRAPYLKGVEEGRIGAAEISGNYQAANCVSVLLHAGHKLSGADLSNLNLRSADLTRGDFTGTNFSKSDLTGADFSGSTLVKANFEGANLADCSFGEFGKIEAVWMGPSDHRFGFSTSNGILRFEDFQGESEPLSRRLGHRTIFCGILSPNRVYLVACGSGKDGGGELQKWRLANLQELFDAGVSVACSAVTCSSDSVLVAVGDREGGISLLSLSDLGLKRQSHRLNKEVQSLAFDGEGKVLYSASADGQIAAWDATTLSHLASTKEFTGEHLLCWSGGRIHVMNYSREQDERLVVEHLRLEGSRFISASPRSRSVESKYHALAFGEKKDGMRIVAYNPT